MAMSHDLHVIPHGSSVYSYHLQYAFTNCPLAEYINLSPQVGEREGEREGEGERGGMGGGEKVVLVYYISLIPRPVLSLSHVVWV